MAPEKVIAKPTPEQVEWAKRTHRAIQIASEMRDKEKVLLDSLNDPLTSRFLENTPKEQQYFFRETFNEQVGVFYRLVRVISRLEESLEASKICPNCCGAGEEEKKFSDDPRGIPDGSIDLFEPPRPCSSCQGTGWAKK